MATTEGGLPVFHKLCEHYQNCPGPRTGQGILPFQPISGISVYKITVFIDLLATHEQ